MSEYEYRRNPLDSTKPRIAGILQEHGLLASSGYVNQIYEIGLAEKISFMDETAIVRMAKYGCKKCRDKNEPCIHIVPENEPLWTDVFQGFEERDTPGNRSMLLSESPRPINAANLSKTFHAIMRSGDPGGKLGVTREEYARQQEQAERERMIRELTANGSFVVVRPSGEKVRFDTSGRPIEFTANGMTPVGGQGRASDPGFDGMDFDALKQFYETVMEQRRLKSLSPAELRKEIAPQRQKALEASSASLRPTPAGGVELVNPDNGQTISDKRSLIRFVNADRDNTKRLIQKNGVTVPALAREFERILNS